MEANQNYTDQELFMLIAKNDQEAFTIVFHKYRSRLFDYAVTLTKTTATAEEIVQDVFLKIWTNREKLTEVDNPVGYIFRMAKNAGVDFLRKLAVGRKLQGHLSVADQDNTTIDTLNLMETRRLIAGAMENLTPAQREVFYLSRYEGLRYEEIADKLQISRNTVRNHLVASIRTIRSHLSVHYDLVVALILTATFENLLA